MGLLEPIFYIARLLVDVYYNIIIIQVILHWLIHFKIIRTDTMITIRVMNFLYAVTEPAYRKISKFIKPIRGIDISPFVLIIVLNFISRFLLRLSIWALS